MNDTSSDPAASENREAEDPDSLGFGHELYLIGKVIWELTGQSIGRLILTFVFVFFASFLPALLLIFGLTISTQTYTRGGLLILVLICLIPMSALVGFNYVAYRGLSDIVKKLGLGKMLGAEFIAYLEPSGRMRLPLNELSDKLKLFSKETRREARSQSRGVQGLFYRVVNGMIFYTATFALNRIAKGCVVDGEVDLERFASAIADRADDLFISYFKKVLWDLTRLMISVGVLMLWLLIIAVTQLVKLMP